MRNDEARGLLDELCTLGVISAARGRLAPGEEIHQRASRDLAEQRRRIGRLGGVAALCRAVAVLMGEGDAEPPVGGPGSGLGEVPVLEVLGVMGDAVRVPESWLPRPASHPAAVVGVPVLLRDGLEAMLLVSPEVMGDIDRAVERLTP